MLFFIKNTIRLLFIGLFIIMPSFSQICFAKKVKIAFHINFMSVRGVEVSVYDYADFNETILGNESIILNDLEIFNGPKSGFHYDYSHSAREKFVKRFPGRFFDYTGMHQAEEILKRENVDLLYVQKGGTSDNKLSKICKNIVHAVFTVDVHGDAYATISDFISARFPALNVPVVPYIVYLPDISENLRKELHIPADAVVIGRHGGWGTFDIEFAKDAVRQLAQENKDWYFLFLNTQKFCDLPNVLFLPATADMVYKTKFINTCDVMLHARELGETFGLACAEFSIRNKPIITYVSTHDFAHIQMLADKGFYYKNKQELLDVVRSVASKIDEIRAGTWDCYSKYYNPAVVMKKFDEIFIQPLIKDELIKS